MVKPKGTIGSTKMKILAIVHHKGNTGDISYGYNIWQCLKNDFLVYLNDCDVRNVYHHLKELCDLGYLMKIEPPGEVFNARCLYQVTERGEEIRNKYLPFLKLLERTAG